MTEIIKQYGEMIIAMVGTIGFFIVMGNLFFACDGMLVNMILIWLNGGC